MAGHILVITFTGRDRPGIVHRLAAVVREHGGNWESSRMASLAGRFAGILEVDVDPAAVAPLVSALRAVEGLDLRVEHGTPVERPVRTLRLALTGQDRPGIVREVAHALAERAVNIEELETRTVEAPMAGGLLFEAHAEVTAPSSLGIEVLRASLEQIAQDLMVEISLVEGATSAGRGSG